MKRRRSGNGGQILFCCVLGGCAQVLGADEVEYVSGQAGAGSTAAGTGDAGTLSAPAAGAPAFGDCAGTKPPLPVNVEGKFCIDSTEVTNGQYLEFLNESDGFAQPVECAWNVPVGDVGGFRPGIAHLWPPSQAILDSPVGGVDWCDARAYCAWAGKRLCGRLDQSPPAFSDYDTPQSELYYACSKGGKQAFPYGDSFDPAACVTDGRDQTLQVKSLPGCEGGFAGIYDLSGNVGEWQAPCSIRNGPDDICRLGSYGVLNSSSAVDNWSCGADYTLHRNTITNFAGIRCCSDVL